MKIKGILKEQEVSLDPHGHYEMTSFDDSRYDFHLHKKTKRPIDGKERYVVIRIPLNSDRKVSITSDKEQIDAIPRKLKNEINDRLLILGHMVILNLSHKNLCFNKRIKKI